MMRYKLAVSQASAGENIAENFAILARLVQQAAEQHCQAVCFPEAFLTGYNLDALALTGITQNSCWLKQVAALAVETGVDIIVGFTEQQEDRYYISQGIFSCKGKAAVYHKTHLGIREAQQITAGNDLPVYQLSCGLTIGIALCVENHYPQLIQCLAEKGAEVVFAPHAVPRKAGDRRFIWGKYIPARSYDNRLYMACCNQWDAVKFAGGCLVTDPKGEVVTGYFQDGEKLLSFIVDSDLVAEYRQNKSMGWRYYPSYRREELYK